MENRRIGPDTGAAAGAQEGRKSFDRRRGFAFAWSNPHHCQGYCSRARMSDHDRKCFQRTPEVVAPS